MTSEQAMALMTQMNDLARRVTALENPAPAVRKLGRGKYAHKTHAEVIKEDPAYVLFIQAQGYASYGFTGTDYEEAKAAVMLLEKEGKEKPPVKAVAPRANPYAAPSKGGAGFDDMDDDIPF